MKAVHHLAGTGHGSSPWRRLVLAVVVLVLLWPALLAPLHSHSAEARGSGRTAAAGPLLVRHQPAPAPGNDADVCPLCRELLKVAACLAPPAGLVVVAMVVALPRYAMAAFPPLAVAQPPIRRSRAPPLSPKR